MVTSITWWLSAAHAEKVAPEMKTSGPHLIPIPQLAAAPSHRNLTSSHYCCKWFIIQQQRKTTIREILLTPKGNLCFSLFPFKYLTVTSLLVKMTGITDLLQPGQATWLQDWQQISVPTPCPTHFNEMKLFIRRVQDKGLCLLHWALLHYCRLINYKLII